MTGIISTEDIVRVQMNHLFYSPKITFLASSKWKLIIAAKEHSVTSGSHSVASLPAKL